MYEVGLQLKDLFDRVCNDPNSVFSESDFWWDPAPATILDHELLVYFLPDASKSVIKAAHPQSPLDTAKSGNTYYHGPSPRISEVYVNPVLRFRDPHILLANLCFHELMHNKLAPFDVHVKGGGGLATAGTITKNTSLSATNIELMAKALGKRVPQYKGAL
jgi:hypothetical protein